MHHASERCIGALAFQSVCVRLLHNEFWLSIKTNMRALCVTRVFAKIWCPLGGLRFEAALQARRLAFARAASQTLRNRCVGKIINLKLSACDVLSTLGCLRAPFFQRWLARGRYHFNRRLSTGVFFSRSGCLEQATFQYLAICRGFSFNPGLSATDFLSTLACLHSMFYQP